MKSFLKEIFFFVACMTALVFGGAFLVGEKPPTGNGQTFQEVFGKETGGYIPLQKARGDIMAHDDGTYSVFLKGRSSENHPGFMINIQFRPQKDLSKIKGEGRIFFEPVQVLVGSSPFAMD